MSAQKQELMVPRSQCFSLLFYLLFVRDWNAVVQYHTIQCLLIFCKTYHRQPSVCFTEASRFIYFELCYISGSLAPFSARLKIRSDLSNFSIMPFTLSCVTPVLISHLCRHALYYKDVITYRKLRCLMLLLLCWLSRSYEISDTM